MRGHRDLVVWQKAMDLVVERADEVGRMLAGLRKSLQSLTPRS